MNVSRQMNHPAAELFSEFDRLFRQSWRRPSTVGACRGASSFQVHEAEDAWHLRADLPGFQKEDLNITLEDDVLQVRAERAETERAPARSFSQALRLPEEVKRPEIAANLELGILEITLPKSEPAKPETLRINVN